ncbi:hypothetical protein PoB_005908700 [Plakobranchus ocellatus]|uniref:Uncharacterized protein n=1 Tax=Plakobranchus ocellatus TaxID=259542 RepID=A0AAV4CLY5_9GAST|nr:hypothetical protein PoB_005908700 [Plakobranchus ocellatus]
MPVAGLEPATEGSRDRSHGGFTIYCATNASIFYDNYPYKSETALSIIERSSDVEQISRNLSKTGRGLSVRKFELQRRRPGLTEG